MSGTSSRGGPVGLHFMIRSTEIMVKEHLGTWLVTVPDGDKTRIVAQCESEAIADMLYHELLAQRE